MPIAQTSIESYNAIAPNLPECQYKVWWELKRCPDGLTIKEISRKLMWDAGTVSARIDELIKLGYIYRLPLKRHDRVTGKLAMVHVAREQNPQMRLF